MGINMETCEPKSPAAGDDCKVGTLQRKWPTTDEDATQLFHVVKKDPASVAWNKMRYLSGGRKESHEQSPQLILTLSRVLC